MQLKVEKTVQKFDRNKIKKLLTEENDYICNLLTTLDVPERIENEEEINLCLKNVTKIPQKLAELKLKKQKSGPPAPGTQKSPEDVQNKIQAMRVKVANRKTKDASVSKKSKSKKKKNKDLQKKIMLHLKTEQNKKDLKEFKEEKNVDLGDVKPKLEFNKDEKMVFSKFDFAAGGNKYDKSKKGKKNKSGPGGGETNPKKMLKTIKDQKKEISQLLEEGETAKATEKKQEIAWKKVFDKTAGKKVKDDPELLMKTIKKRDKQHKKSKTDWKERGEKVKAKIAAQCKRREDNMAKKAQEKKVHKNKKLTKRGRVIPGF